MTTAASRRWLPLVACVLGYALLTSVLSLFLLRWAKEQTRTTESNDVILALSTAGGLLLVPFVFLLGATLVHVVAKSFGASRAGWTWILRYTVAALAVWLVGTLASRRVGVGSGDGGLVYLSALFAYSLYLALPTILVVLVSSLVVVISRSVREGRVPNS